MSEETFRIVVTAAVAIASLALIVQAFVVMALARTARKVQEKFDPIIDRADIVIRKLEQTSDSIGPDVGPAVKKLRAAAERVGPILDKVGAVVERAGPTVDQATKLLATTNRILEDTRPKIAEVSTGVVRITRESREQVERLGDLLNDAADRARNRLEQIDQTVDSTVEEVQHVGEALKSAVMRPVKEVNGIAAGISAAVSTLVKRPRRSSVDSATQDEEMFI